MINTSGNAAGITFMSDLRLFEDLQQILTVAAVLQRGRESFQACGIYVSLAKDDLLRARDLQSLPLLNGLNEHARLQQRLVRARIQPCKAPPQDFGLQLALLQVSVVQISDLKLTARRWFQRGG